MRAYLWIFLGAVFGAGFSYFLARFVAKALSASFPYGALIIKEPAQLRT